MKNNVALYLIPTPIGETGHKEMLPAETIDVLPHLKHFLVENIRSARRFLRAAGYAHNFDDVWFLEINEHNQMDFSQEWLQPIKNGHSVGLLSEAGLPCVADPGYTVVRIAQQQNIHVVPLGGPSSLMKALMASGLNGQQFTFHGYLPVKVDELKRKIKIIEEQAIKGYTQIFIETPYRNERMFESLLSACRPETLLCVAAAIDTSNQFIKTASISQWKKLKPSLKGLPCVFCIGC
jgi:16S rRNA (cytidine1402-2'-O)-methyltransferase